MLSYDGTHRTWVRDPHPPTLEERLNDEYGLAYGRYARLCDDGVDAYDPRRARLDAYLTGLENLLDWSE